MYILTMSFDLWQLKVVTELTFDVIVEFDRLGRFSW